MTGRHATQSEPAQGLQIQLDLPPSVPTGVVQARLVFRNETWQPMRVLLVQPEEFRLDNSMLRVFERNKVVSLQPDQHASAQKIDGNDVLVLAPGETKTVAQSLKLVRPGSYEIEWTYENKQRSSPVGDLWVGSLSTRRAIQVQ